MRALIIGGDHVDAAKRALYASGYTEVVHWTGRKNNDLKRPLPTGVTRTRRPLVETDEGPRPRSTQPGSTRQAWLVGGQRVKPRRRTRNRRQSGLQSRRIGKRLQKLLCVRVARGVKDRVDIRLFCGHPTVHDEHAVAQFGHDAEIVGDQNDRQAQLPLQACQEV